MKRQTRILAGTAIGLLMASTPLFAAPALTLSRPHVSQMSAGAPLILAQADQEDDQQRKRKKGEKAGRKGPDAEQAAPKQEPKAEAAPKPEAKPQTQAAQPKPEPQPKADAKSERKPKAQQAEDNAAQPKPESKPEPKAAEKAPEPKPEKQAAKPATKSDANDKAAERAKPQRPVQASEPKPAEQAAEPKPARQAAEPEPAREAAQPDTQRPFKAQNDNQKQPAAADGGTAGNKDKLRKFLKDKQQDGEKAAERPKAGESKQAGQPKAGQPEQTAQPGEQPEPGGKTDEKQAQSPDKQPPANENRQAAKPGDGGQTPTKTVLPGNLNGGKQRRQERVEEQAGAETLPDNAAPVFDSDKRRARGDGKKGEARNDREQRKQEQANRDAPPPPKSDSAAQKVKLGADIVRSLLGGDTEGQRFEADNRDQRREFWRRRHHQRDNAEVVKQYNDNRTIIEINNRIYVDNNDSDRLIRRNDRVYYDELPRGRTREVIVRGDGVKVITVRNRYGDVIRRSRVMSDGREVVLVYVPDDEIRRDAEWVDPGRDLPPLRLTVPVGSYILEAAAVEQPDRYYDFLEQPPVAPIERIYSVEDVKRSARVRDTMPRIDLDTINFATGSAEIAESEVDELDAIAQAILKVLNDNPGETFLIEGHTDAVGSEESNLVLSDRRAEAVADALTSVYDIPPENLVTQGYGEEYLKIDTEAAERANRRVAMRRITPLVAPVASAE